MLVPSPADADELPEGPGAPVWVLAGTVAGEVESGTMPVKQLVLVVDLGVLALAGAAWWLQSMWRGRVMLVVRAGRAPASPVW